MALDYRWRLRELMAARGIFTAGELGPHLAAHGVRLSDSQVWRLVTGRPERLNLRVLVVLCAILDCTPDDLIERIEVEQPKKHAATGRAASTDVVPKRARIHRPDDG